MKLISTIILGLLISGSARAYELPSYLQGFDFFREDIYNSEAVDDYIGAFDAAADFASFADDVNALANEAGDVEGINQSANALAEAHDAMDRARENLGMNPHEGGG